MKVNFYCRQSKVGKDKLSPIEISVSINNKRTFIQTPVRYSPKRFEKEREKGFLKEYIDTTTAKLNELQMEMMRENIPLTAEAIKGFFKRGTVKEIYTCKMVFDDFIELKTQQEQAKEIKKLTYNKYINARDYFYSVNNITGDTIASTITIEHFYKMQNELVKKGLQMPTIYNHMSRCKGAFKYAFDRGKIPTLPYAGFKFRKGEKSDIVWLTREELKKIWDYPYCSKRLYDISRMFLLQCYSGLAYSDLFKLSSEDFKVNNLGQMYIEKRRTKTGKKYTSVLLPEGKRIVEEYGGVLPKKSNQKLNEYLKEIQALTGIQKELHSHLGRTTYVCYLYSNHFSIENICKMVGDTARIILKHYAEMDNQTIFEDMREAGLACERVDPNFVKQLTKTPIPMESIKRKKR